MDVDHTLTLTKGAAAFSGKQCLTYPTKDKTTSVTNTSRNGPKVLAIAQRLPPSFSQPSHVARLGSSQREAFARDLNYARYKVWPKHLNDGDIKKWTVEFYYHPVVAHASQYAVAVHQDLLDNRVSKSSSPEALAHKVCALRLIRTMLSSGTSSDRVHASFAVGLLATHELNDEMMKAMHESNPLPFDALMPPPRELRVLSQLGLMPSHAEAFRFLLGGGMDARHVKNTGQFETWALADLWYSSKDYTAPTCPNPWRVDVSHFSPDPGTNVPGVESAQGRGFFAEVSFGLTARALAVLTRLAALNQKMAALASTKGPRHPTWSPHHHAFMVTLNALQHQLLSLPPWDSLEIQERCDSSQEVYECCRLTAVIYSNAALLALAPHTGWHTRLAHTLRLLLEKHEYSSWSGQLSAMLTWSLVVGALAAYRSHDREFFEVALRKQVKKMQLKSWVLLEEVLTNFIWSKKACQHGAAMLWLSVK
ncbi:hypothetical protein LTR17_019177 [Elasticomyces elasticus]|nr:hypothetical protein LTR17_019177 [Elasticomyces elasticus]